MCRLFGLSGGERDVRATFWLLEAPDSLGDAADSVVVASEPMDHSPDWRSLAPGELVHVDRDLRVRTTVAVPEPPRRRLRLEDLRSQAAASQRPG